MPIEPDDAELLQAVMTSLLLDVHVSMPAVCVAYSSASQRGDFQPTVKASVKDDDGRNVFETRPVIQNVPVSWMRAGGYYRHNPLAKGDSGTLVFSEEAYGVWRSTGQLSPPGDVTRHSIAYPIFLPGLFPDAKPMGDAPASGEAVEIVPAGGHVRFSKEGAGGDAQFVALANMVLDRLTAIATKFDSHTHMYLPGPGSATPTAVPVPLIGVMSSVAATSLKSD